MNAPLAPIGLKPHRITVDEWFSFAESGAFDGLPRMELLDGVPYEMSPQHSRHVLAKNRLLFRLQSRIVELGLSFEALSEPTVAIDDATAPEPDIILCANPKVERFYPPSSVLLAIEVSLSRLEIDLGYKRGLYASAAIPEYWVVDIVGRTIHQFWNPGDGSYRESRKVAFGENISSQTIAEITVETDGLI